MISRMRCRAKRRVRKARGAADIVYIGKPSNAADAPFGSNPKGRERFGRLSWQMSALVALTIGPLLPRAPALNHAQNAQIAPRRIREIKSDRLLAFGLPPGRSAAAPGQALDRRAQWSFGQCGRKRPQGPGIDLKCLIR